MATPQTSPSKEARHADSEDTAIEALRKYLAKWSGIIVLVGGGIGGWFKLQQDLQALKDDRFRDREDFRAFISDYRSSHAFSPVGFSDPTTRAGLDAHLREFLKNFNAVTRGELNHWVNLLFQLNPELKRPAE